MGFLQNNLYSFAEENTLNTYLYKHMSKNSAFQVAGKINFFRNKDFKLTFAVLLNRDTKAMMKVSAFKSFKTGYKKPSRHSTLRSVPPILF